MPRALKTCSTTGCPEPTSSGRCDTCKAKAEQARGSARERGYDQTHARRFRNAVLRRDPLCTCTDTRHGHGVPCLAISTDADHHPRDRRALVAAGLDPNDPTHGRGLCHGCHSKHTAVAQPGGWHAV